MKLETILYETGKGWSVEQFPPLDGPHTLILIFGTPSFIDNPQAIVDLQRAYPKAHILGCSTAGQIFDTQVSDDTLAVGIVKFEHAEIASATALVQSAQNSYATGQSIAQQLYRDSLKAVFILSDGLQVNGSELIRGLNNVLPESVMVTGGLAGDLQRSWVIQRDVISSGLVAAIGLYGDQVRVRHGSKGGWDIFGPERLITHSEGNVLYTLDDQPALQLYKRYLGDRATELPNSALLFPLALRAHSSDKNSVVRTILSIDEESQAMVFAGDIPQGHLAQLMKANFDRLIDGASDAALMACPEEPTTSEILSVAISCVGRRLVFGERTEEELEATLDILPSHTKQIGFYSNGEISPYTNGRCDLHNQTMTLTTISEE